MRCNKRNKKSVYYVQKLIVLNSTTLVYIQLNDDGNDFDAIHTSYINL